MRPSLAPSIVRGIVPPFAGTPSVPRGATAAFIIRVVGAGLAFASQVLLARWMGGHAFGIYSSVAVVVAIAGSLCVLGFGSAALQFIPAYVAKAETGLVAGFMRAGASIALFGSGLAAALIGAFALLAIDGLDRSLAVALLIAAAALPAYALTDFFDGVARARQWMVLALAPPYLARPLLALGIAAVLAANAPPRCPRRSGGLCGGELGGGSNPMADPPDEAQAAAARRPQIRVRAMAGGLPAPHAVRGLDPAVVERRRRAHEPVARTAGDGCLFRGGADGVAARLRSVRSRRCRNGQILDSPNGGSPGCQPASAPGDTAVVFRDVACGSGGDGGGGPSPAVPIRTGIHRGLCASCDPCRRMARSSGGRRLARVPHRHRAADGGDRHRRRRRHHRRRARDHAHSGARDDRRCRCMRRGHGGRGRGVGRGCGASPRAKAFPS